MALPNVYTAEVANTLKQRIDALTNTTQPQWGKMNVAQTLTHCNVTYELAYEDKHPRPNFFMRFMLKSFVKKIVCNEVPYKPNSRTAPVFMVAAEQDFEKEQSRLKANIDKTVSLGENYHEGKENHGFGKLTAIEWNNMFYKHLDHHLKQFGV